MGLPNSPEPGQEGANVGKGTQVVAEQTNETAGVLLADLTTAEDPNTDIDREGVSG